MRTSPRDIVKLFDMLQYLLLYGGEDVRKEWNRSLLFADEESMGTSLKNIGESDGR